MSAVRKRLAHFSSVCAPVTWPGGKVDSYLSERNRLHTCEVIDIRYNAQRRENLWFLYISCTDDCFGVAIDGQIPETMIDRYIGEPLEQLVDGFAAAEKPEGCGWMNQSVIKSIVNHMGSVLVELEPAK